MPKPTKSDLRRRLRAARREHVQAQPDSIRSLLFHRPPAPLLNSISEDAVIGLYAANEFEAPTAGYAKFFQERGHTISLPFFSDESAAMAFREHCDPYDINDLDTGPFGIMQPRPDAQAITPTIMFVPLVGFTEDCQRLGQGGGHYDRYFAEHPDTRMIGLAWDAQMIDPASALDTEPHDIAMDAIVTPTRIYGALS